MSDESIPNSPTDLPAEFHAAISLDRFHRYALVETENGPRMYFGLVGQDGSHIYYSADSDAGNGLAFNMASLVEQMNQMAAGQEHVRPTIPFETLMMFPAICHGADGPTVILTFATLSGAQLVTRLRPEVAADLYLSLDETMRAMPTLPRPTRAPMPKRDHEGAEKDDGVIYFGQSYDPEVLQAFGVLMVRASLVEKSLISLLAKLGKMPPETAKSLFYSTRSFKARTDLVKSLIQNKNKENPYLKAIEKAGDAANRRNALVHADWTLAGDKLILDSQEPNKKPKQSVFVTAKSILDVATAFQNASMMLDALAMSSA